MVSWVEFRQEQAKMATEGAGLLYHFGAGLAFLATVREDGGPRMHPICPLLTDQGLYAFIVRSPKQKDLHRDGRFAMHSFPLEDNEDAFYVTGRASYISDHGLRRGLADQFVDERARFDPPRPAEDHHLFEFRLATAMLTRTTGHGDSAPEHTVWRPY